MLPCHTFAGIVEQWKTSRHYAVYVANLNGAEVPTWTGATPCGTCHASDAIELRVAGNVGHGLSAAGPVALDRGQINYKTDGAGLSVGITYAGLTQVAMVGCNTCHAAIENDPHVSGGDYKPGTFAVRMPIGADDEAVIERSSAVGLADGTNAGKFGAGNACIWCHKSRMDVTNYIGATNNISSAYWGPHEGPQTDIYSGKGGYHYAGMTYDNSAHQSFTGTGSSGNGCVRCHMPAVPENMGYGDHSFYARVSACQSCHGPLNDFDVNSGQSNTKLRLRALRTARRRSPMQSSPTTTSRSTCPCQATSCPRTSSCRQTLLARSTTTSCSRAGRRSACTTRSTRRSSSTIPSWPWE
jgi:hypothetical protein